MITERPPWLIQAIEAILQRNANKLRREFKQDIKDIQNEKQPTKTTTEYVYQKEQTERNYTKDGYY